MIRRFILTVLATLFCFNGGCAQSLAVAKQDTDADADVSGDADTDSDTDGDTDTDSDGDTDADSDGDTDADSDGDTDADSDADTDTDSDTGSDPGYLFFEDFEDQDTEGWVGGSAYDVTVTDSTAAAGTNWSLSHIGGTGSFTYAGLQHEFDSIKPTHISYWARSGRSWQNDTYFVFHGPGTISISFNHLVLIYFSSGGDIRVLANPGVAYPDYVENQWYHIELRNIDWDTKQFDVYLDDVELGTDLGFKDPAVTSLDRIDLLNPDATAIAGYDEILFE
jgi:hypothetical protein